MSHPEQAAREVTMSNLSTYEISDLPNCLLTKQKRHLFNNGRGAPVFLFSSVLDAFFFFFFLLLPLFLSLTQLPSRMAKVAH